MLPGLYRTTASADILWTTRDGRTDSLAPRVVPSAFEAGVVRMQQIVLLIEVVALLHGKRDVLGLLAHVRHDEDALTLSMEVQEAVDGDRVPYMSVAEGMRELPARRKGLRARVRKTRVVCGGTVGA